MSKERAEAARSAMKDKAKRLTTDPHEKVDSSSWTPPEPTNSNVQTGMRPVSPRAFKRGGKIVQMLGKTARHHAGKAPRASGGKAVIDDYMNRNQKDANSERPGGKAHVGGMAAGGAPDGGSFVPTERFNFRPANATLLSAAAGAKKGGAIKSDDAKQDKKTIRSMVKTEALKRKAGGRTKRDLGGIAKALISPAGSVLGLLGGGKKDKDDDDAGKCRGGMTRATGGKTSLDGDLQGTRPTGGRRARASGGKAGKGKTTVNINISQPQQAQPPAAAPPMPPPMPPHPPVPPMAMPPGVGAGPPPGMPPGMPGMPPGLPPGMPRKQGGRVHMTAGAGSGLGRIEKTKMQKRVYP